MKEQKMQSKIVKLESWNRYPKQNCTLYRPERYSELHPQGASSIARGSGLSYGDAALNENANVILTERINRILNFDERKGIITVEAGITLEEILDVIVPNGWFLPVTPGTQFITLGGAVAADVHGKNHHHDGSISQFIVKLELITPKGVIICSVAENSDIFWATIGGMGLTGIIGEVTINLRSIESAYVSVTHRGAENLDALFRLFSDTSLDDQYSVAWIDCMSSGSSLGRGVYMSGHHAMLDEVDNSEKREPFKSKIKSNSSIPFDFPRMALNSLSVKAFNAYYYRVNSNKKTPFLSDYKEYFYPLDSVNNWNRMYGKNGFLQYQCVIPELMAQEGIRNILEKVSSSKQSSFLAVLKRMGAEGAGMLSFPMAGYTLALDLKMNNKSVFTLLNELDEIVVRNGGKVYLAKDARLSRESFLTMYPRSEEWAAIKQQIDPDNILSSSLSRRLGIGATA